MESLIYSRHFFYIALSYGIGGLGILAMIFYIRFQSLKTKRFLQKWFSYESNSKI